MFTKNLAQDQLKEKSNDSMGESVYQKNQHLRVKFLPDFEIQF